MDDYSKYTGEKVTLTKTDGTVLEGRVEAASAVAVVLRVRGRQGTELIEESEIASIEVISEVPRLKRRKLPAVREGKFRDHLIDRHGYRVADIEALTEEQAVELHESLDHKDLGHYHAAEVPAEAAIAEAEDSDGE